MIWLARALAGPVLWALLFAGVYALHGTGCHLGWTGQAMGPVDLHHGAMWGLWALGLAGHLALIAAMPAGQGRARQIIVAGCWIGFIASLATLFPVLFLSTCA